MLGWTHSAGSAKPCANFQTVVTPLSPGVWEAQSETSSQFCSLQQNALLLVTSSGACGELVWASRVWQSRKKASCAGHCWIREGLREDGSHRQGPGE